MKELSKYIKREEKFFISFSLADTSTMQVSEDLVKGTGKPLTAVLGLKSIRSNSAGFHVPASLSQPHCC